MAKLPELNSDGASINFVTAEIPEFKHNDGCLFWHSEILPTTESFTKAFSTMIKRIPLVLQLNLFVKQLPILQENTQQHVSG